MPLAFDTTGLQRHDERTWFDPRTGDQVSLTYFDLEPDLPASLEELPLLRQRLAHVLAEAGTLVEAHVVTIDSVPALYQVVKLPIPGRQTGLMFVAALTVPKATGSVVLQVLCQEGNTSGIRESMVSAQIGFENCFPPHPYAPGLQGMLPWNVADDQRWDNQFPEHPLSRARAWAHRTIQTARVDPNFARLPPFRPTAQTPEPLFGGAPNGTPQPATQEPPTFGTAADAQHPTPEAFGTPDAFGTPPETLGAPTDPQRFTAPDTFGTPEPQAFGAPIDPPRPTAPDPFGTPPEPQTFGTPDSQHFTAPDPFGTPTDAPRPAPDAFGAPTDPPRPAAPDPFGTPPEPQAFGTPTDSQRFTEQDPFGTPPEPQAFGTPTDSQRFTEQDPFGTPPEPQAFGTPTDSQHFTAPDPFGTPADAQRPAPDAFGTPPEPQTFGTPTDPQHPAPPDAFGGPPVSRRFAPPPTAPDVFSAPSEPQAFGAGPADSQHFTPPDSFGAPSEPQAFGGPSDSQHFIPPGSPTAPDPFGAPTDSQHFTAPDPFGGPPDSVGAPPEPPQGFTAPPSEAPVEPRKPRPFPAPQGFESPAESLDPRPRPSPTPRTSEQADLPRRPRPFPAFEPPAEQSLDSPPAPNGFDPPGSLSAASPDNAAPEPFAVPAEPFDVNSAFTAPEPEPVAPPPPPTAAGDVLHTVLVGVPIGDYLPLWQREGQVDTVTFWRMSDPDAVRARLGTGVESRSAVDTGRYREAAMFSPERQMLFLMDRYRDDSGNLGGTSEQLFPATEDEAYQATDDKALSGLYSWLGEVMLAAVRRGEFVAVETGGWDVPVNPVVLVMLRTDGRDWHSVVETSPVPVGAPVWRDQQPVEGSSQILASPATDQTLRASGLLTRFAINTWSMHPFQLGISFGPNPTLQDQ